MKSFAAPSRALFCATVAQLFLTTALLQADPAAGQSVKAEATAPDIWHQDYLTGDWGGVRTQLSNKGVNFGLNSITEVLGNPSGGVKQGAIVEGRLEMALDLDFKALVGLDGGSFHVNAYEIYGKGLSSHNIENILTVSNIEAYNTLRLFDLWYQQEFLDGKISLRFGQLAADDEFMISDYGATFMNGTFGWMALAGANLPSGGPAYPLAAPGVRLKVSPISQFSLMAAVFDGDPGDSPGTDNPQGRDSTGTRIDFNQGAFSIFEAAYKLNQEDNARGLPGTYTLGGFYATQNYNDVGVDDTGLSLANPASSGRPLQHSGEWGVYFMADQMVWRKPESATTKDPKDLKNVAAEKPSDQGLGLFWRIGGTPADRNLISFYTDGGLNYKGLFPGRDDDVLGLAVAYAKISNDIVGVDRDNDAISGVPGPIQNEEMAIELTYQAKLTPWWTLQPDFQYIVHPGGNVADPDDAGGTQAIPNAVVLGIRTTINF